MNSIEFIWILLKSVNSSKISEVPWSTWNRLNSLEFIWILLKSANSSKIRKSLEVPEIVWIHLNSFEFSWSQWILQKFQKSLKVPEIVWIHSNSFEFSWSHLNYPEIKWILLKFLFGNHLKSLKFCRNLLKSLEVICILLNFSEVTWIILNFRCRITSHYSKVQDLNQRFGSGMQICS